MDNNQVSMNNNDMTLSIFEIASASIHTESKKDCAFETRGEFVFLVHISGPGGPRQNIYSNGKPRLLVCMWLYLCLPVLFKNFYGAVSLTTRKQHRLRVGLG